MDSENNRLLLIINPVSGTSNKKELADKITSRLSAEGFEVETALTACRGDATRLARLAVDNGMAGVLAYGGDGTVNETARALCGTDVSLGIIPAGSGNGLARHLGIPIDPMLSLDVIAERHIVPCDYATVNGSQFFCTFGVGFDAAVSHRFARQGRRGMATYVKSAFSEYLNYRPQVYTVSANGVPITEKAFLVAVCNASQYGNNAYIAPGASITDGLLDITIVHSGTPLDAAVLGFDLMSGYISRNTMIQTFRAPSAVIYRTGSGEAHLDGEPVMMPAVLDFRCCHRGLKVFATTTKTRFRPIVTPVKSMMNDWKIALANIFGR